MKTSYLPAPVLFVLWLLAACEAQTEAESSDALFSVIESNDSIDFGDSLIEPLSMPLLKTFSVPDCSQQDELPPNVESASIDIVKVRLRGQSGEWFSKDLSQTPINFDLANLGCAVWDNFSKFLPPEGSYDHMRLETEELGLVEHTDGAQFDLEVPSGEQSGIKIFFNPPLVVEYGKVTVCKFKYDRSKSIQAIPKNNPRSYHFKPVVKAECSDPIDLDGDDEEESSSSSSSVEESSSSSSSEEESSSSSSSESSTSSDSSSSSQCTLEEGNDTDPGYDCLSDYELPVEEEPSFLLLKLEI